MFSKVKSSLLGLAVFGLLGSATLTVVAAPTSSAAKPNDSCNGRFLTLPAWYNGLVGKEGGECMVVSPSDLGGSADTQLSRFIWKIVLNIIEIILQIIAYTAVGFVMYGGFKYISSTGRADKIKEGRELIINAVIGLAISILAASIVGYIGANL